MEEEGGRVKANCSKCGVTVSLLVDFDTEGLDGFEYKCPSCEDWAYFELAKEE